MTSMPTTIRFIGPNGKAASLAVNGRVYSVAAGGVIDVPLMDAPGLAANSWCEVAGSGSTAQRPANPFFGQLYHDTTVNLIIVFEGSAWRNPATGSTI
jgi:hypothetical protein